MNTQKDYLEELKELWEVYDNEEVASSLGVTVRAVQTYLNKDNPKPPRQKTINKIRETYAKHLKSGTIKNPTQQSEQGLKDEIINLLHKQVAMLELQVDHLKLQLTQVEELRTYLAEMKQSVLVIHSLQQSYQEYWAEHYPPKGVDPETVKEAFRNKAFAFLKEYRRKGIVLEGDS